MSLYEHQHVGAAWLAGRARGYLGDTPGLGKTRTLIRAARMAGAENPLVVCPAIVRTHWHREGWVDARTYGGQDFSVKSYEEIVRGGNALMKTLIVDEKIDALILDEAHYLKHAGSKRTLQLLGKDGYARRLPRVYCASGTPVPKNPAEMWTTIASLFPEVAIEHKLRTPEEFLARFCVVTRRLVRGRWIDKIEPELRNEVEFRELLGKIMLRRTLDDVGLDVPPLDWQTTLVAGGSRHDDTRPPGADELAVPALTGTPWHDELWRRVHAGESIAEMLADPHVARMRRRLGEVKAPLALALLRSQLEESSEKVVVFAYHRSVLEALAAGLATFGVAYIDGDVSDARRNERIDRFQNDPRCRVFLGQNIACQTGITLTAARRCFLVEPEWTAVVNDQLGHRVARIGQKAERCIAHMVTLADTIDEAIIKQNIREVRMAHSALES